MYGVSNWVKIGFGNVVATVGASQQMFLSKNPEAVLGVQFCQTEADIRAWISCSVAAIVGLFTALKIAIELWTTFKKRKK